MSFWCFLLWLYVENFCVFYISKNWIYCRGEFRIIEIIAIIDKQRNNAISSLLSNLNSVIGAVPIEYKIVTPSKILTEKSFVSINKSEIKSKMVLGYFSSKVLRKQTSLSVIMSIERKSIGTEKITELLWKNYWWICYLNQVPHTYKKMEMIWH